MSDEGRADGDLKIVLVGDSKCGKTAMLRRYLTSEFVEVRLDLVTSVLFQKRIKLPILRLELPPALGLGLGFG